MVDLEVQQRINRRVLCGSEVKNQENYLDASGKTFFYI
mgnify:CR=1 FL=1